MVAWQEAVAAAAQRVEGLRATAARERAAMRDAGLRTCRLERRHHAQLLLRGDNIIYVAEAGPVG